MIPTMQGRCIVGDLERRELIAAYDDYIVDIDSHMVYTMYIQKESEAKNLCMHK